MNHVRHAPETQNDEAQPTPSAAGTIPAALADVRIKQSGAAAIKIDVPVAADLGAGTTARLRAFRGDAAQTDPSISYQIAPDNAPLVASVADKSDPENYLKHLALGEIRVHLPDGSVRPFEADRDPVMVDLTQGLDIRCSLEYPVESFPVGPMLGYVNIDVTPVPPA